MTKIKCTKFLLSFPLYITFFFFFVVVERLRYKRCFNCTTTRMKWSWQSRSKYVNFGGKYKHSFGQFYARTAPSHFDEKSRQGWQTANKNCSWKKFDLLRQVNQRKIGDEFICLRIFFFFFSFFSFSFFLVQPTSKRNSRRNSKALVKTFRK